MPESGQNARFWACAEWAFSYDDTAFGHPKGISSYLACLYEHVYQRKFAAKWLSESVRPDLAPTQQVVACLSLL